MAIGSGLKESEVEIGTGRGRRKERKSKERKRLERERGTAQLREGKRIEGRKRETNGKI